MTDEAKPAEKQPAFTVEADGTRVRKLVKEIAGNGPSGVINEIRLRPPKYREIMTLGDPSAMIYLEHGAVPQEDIMTIARYVDALAHDQDKQKILPDLLSPLDYRDALALKDAVIDFFRTARA